MKQRDKMRALVTDYGQDKEAVCAAYARAEKRGEVPRQSNVRFISAESYAVALWRDGVRKGWISS